MGLKKGLISVFTLLLLIYVIVWIVFEMDYRTRAANLYGRGEYARAIELFNQVIDSKSDSRDLAEAHVARGLARLKLGDSEGALEDAEKGVSLWPEYAFAHLLRSEVRLSEGDAMRALDHCKAALDASEMFPWSYWGRGNARREAGDLGGALADYDKAIELKPNMAVLAFDRLRAMRPTEDFHTDRSIARRINGDVEGALADCEAALKLDPRFPRAILNRGLVYLSQGRNEESQKDFDRFLELRPGEKGLLEVEIEFLRAGVPPNASKLFLARRAATNNASATDRELEQAPAAKVEDAGAAATNEQQEPVAPQTGIIGFMMRPLPLYVTLVSGLALVFVFTGSYLVLTDIRKMLAGEVSREFRAKLQIAGNSIRVRRVLCLLTGLGLVVLYFLDRQMPTIFGVVVGLFFLSSMNKVGNARKLVTEANGH